MGTTDISKKALVTGASSGIGKSFAEALAAGGTDLVIVAGGGEGVGELAERLRSAHRRDVEVIEADLEKRDQLARIEARLRDRDDIDLLVNNAGYGHTGNFADLDVAQSQGQIDLNIVALTRLAHAALASMRRARRGAILNVASGAAFLPTPTLAVYAATKAYVLSFTQGLSEEVKREGIQIAVVCPGFTRTEFQQRAKYDSNQVPKFAWQTPEQVVEESLSALRARKLICVPGVGNKVTAGLVNLIPRSAIAGIVGRFAGRH